MALNRIDDLVEVGGTTIELSDRGAGPIVLLLHGGDGLKHDAIFLKMLAETARVVAPAHPGFGRSPLPDWISTVDDIAYLYLDLMDQLDLHDVTLVGASIGGWIAAEIAIKCSHRISKLVLVDPIGIKPGDRETRDIPDIYALHPDEVAKLMFHDPKNAPNFMTMSDDDAAVVARNREAAALYLWEPYMHNPQLLRRLHRITVPTLFLRGSSDGLVSAAYLRAYSAAIAGSRVATIDHAGHSPASEQPRALVDSIVGFMGE